MIRRLENAGNLSELDKETKKEEKKIIVMILFLFLIHKIKNFACYLISSLFFKI